MCKNCKEKELELNEVENKEQEISLEDMDKEQLLEVVYSLLDSSENQIELDKEELKENDGFKEGIKKALYYAGFYNCLLNTGFDVDKAYELTLNQNTCDNNQTLQKIINESSEKVAKIQDIKLEQSQI